MRTLSAWGIAVDIAIRRAIGVQVLAFQAVVEMQPGGELPFILDFDRDIGPALLQRQGWRKFEAAAVGVLRTVVSRLTP